MTPQIARSAFEIIGAVVSLLGAVALSITLVVVLMAVILQRLADAVDISRAFHLLLSQGKLHLVKKSKIKVDSDD